MAVKKLAGTVGATVAAKRKQLGLSQEQLAEKIGIQQESLSRMEKGTISPKFERLRQIAEALQCSVADLFREADEDATDRAATIADQLAQLTPEQQNAVVRIVEEAVRGMKAGVE